MFRLFSLAFASAALLTFATTTVWSQEDKGRTGDRPGADRTRTATDADHDKDMTPGREGTIVSVDASGNKLVFKPKDTSASGNTGGTAGSTETTDMTYILTGDTRITCDGKECKLDELKPGQKVRVMCKKGEKDQAVRVEALDKNDSFGNRGTNPDR